MPSKPPPKFPALRERAKEFLWLIPPFLLWMFLFRGFFAGQLALDGDGPSYFYRIQYHLDSMRQGVYPLWNPFYAWGSRDNFDMRFLGEFNPFLFLPILFHAAGLAIYPSYVFYLALYYFVGCAGFYLLAKEIFRERSWAFLAYLLVMFSSLAPALFTEHVIDLLFVPVVWFFYFLLRFGRDPGPKPLLGLTFALMVIATTYLPFYFLVIVTVFCVLFVVLYPREGRSVLVRGWRSLRAHKRAAVLCLFSLAFSLVPGVEWYLEAKDSQYVIAFRNEGAPDPHKASMSLETINLSGISGPINLRDLVGDLDISGKDDIYFYVSIFVYLAIVLSVFNRGNRFLTLLFGLGLSIFMIIVTSAAPVHKFLYDHVYLFRLFRNLFFFLYLLIPVVILFAVEQIRIFLAQQPSTRGGTWRAVIFVWVAHGALALGMSRVEDIIPSSYLALTLSLLFFTLDIPGFLQKYRRASLGLLCAAVLIQPIEVFSHFSRLSPAVETPYPGAVQTPRFSFTRPPRGEEHRIRGFRGYQGAKKVMTDDSGFIGEQYFGTGWSYFLHQNISHAGLENYVRHKFLLYDRTEYLDDDNVPLKRIEQVLTRRENPAFVAEKSAEKNEGASGDETPFAEIIAGESPRFRIVKFGLNEITFKTDFPSRRFIVYNDSYHAGWRAFVNGQERPIVRANVAFKGLWLDPGENVVHLRYGNPWLYGAYLFLTVLMICFLFYFLVAGGWWLVKDIPNQRSATSDQPPSTTHQQPILNILGRSWVYYALAAGVVLSSVQTTRLQLRKMDELKFTLDYPRSFSKGEAPFDKLGFRRAIRYYKRLGEIAPAVSRVMPLDATATISRSREMVGFCYYHLGDYKKSLRFYRQALRLKPEFRWLHYNLGVVHYRLGDDAAAARELSQAMPDPTNLAAYFTPLGTTWWKRPGLKASFQKLAVPAASEVSRRVAKLTVLIEDRRAGEKISPEEEQSLLKPVFHPQTHFIPIGFEEILIENDR